MTSYFNVIKSIYSNLKINPAHFGFAGETYFRPAESMVFRNEIIDKYIFTYQNICVNRKNTYYSDSLTEVLSIIKDIHNDYSFISLARIDHEYKRYVLYTVIEYIMHSICKLLNICFEDMEFKIKFYSQLKISLEYYTDILINLMFSEDIPDIPNYNKNNNYIYDIQDYYSDDSIKKPVLREHVEYDHKLLLIFAYILYYDIIRNDELLICPLLGAAQIPPFFRSVEKYFGKDLSVEREIKYDYVKYSTYDITGFIPLELQLADIKSIYGKYSGVLLLDESLGTGTTLSEIRSKLKSSFECIKVGAVEFRWDKKIIRNNDREWFDINSIDYVTPISYRHYLILMNKIACFKMNIAVIQPYIPFMIYDDRNFEKYMYRQDIDKEKRAAMDILFKKSAHIMDVFYNGRNPNYI